VQRATAQSGGGEGEGQFAEVEDPDLPF